MEFPCRFDAFTGCRVHLGICGSVAAYKTVDLMRRLQRLDVNVSATLTESASRFITPLSFSSLGASPVYGSLFGDDDPFSHLEPGTFAHSFAIIPATANTMAKLAAGNADDMLSAQALSFSRPLLIAPAMNPRMWNNPVTQRNARRLESLGHSVITPSTGLVACGEEGAGKLPEVSDLCLYILQDALRAKSLDTLAGKKVMVTLGPTREQWDDVRVWTNLSTGYMGASFVYAAWLRGAEVHAVAGPGVPDMPPGVKVYDCISAKDMYDVATALWDDMDMGIFTAAVADYSPVPYSGGKFKKDGGGELSISFSPNIDILATLGGQKQHKKILGFAAESSNLEANTQGKLQRKNADIMVGNLISGKGAGFGVPTNTVYICRANGNAEHLPQMSKENLAWRLLDELCVI